LPLLALADSSKWLLIQVDWMLWRVLGWIRPQICRWKQYREPKQLSVVSEIRKPIGNVGLGHKKYMQWRIRRLLKWTRNESKEAFEINQEVNKSLRAAAESNKEWSKEVAEMNKESSKEVAEMIKGWSKEAAEKLIQEWIKP
jgi:hypothetical protein